MRGPGMPSGVSPTKHYCPCLLRLFFLNYYYIINEEDTEGTEVWGDHYPPAASLIPAQKEEEATGLRLRGGIRVQLR